MQNGYAKGYTYPSTGGAEKSRAGRSHDTPVSVDPTNPASDLRPSGRGQGARRRRMNQVQILKSQSSIVALCSKHTRALRFENLYKNQEWLAVFSRPCNQSSSENFSRGESAGITSIAAGEATRVSISGSLAHAATPFASSHAPSPSEWGGSRSLDAGFGQFAAA